MPFDFSAHKVAPGEKPASSNKQNNFIQAAQDAVNAIPAQNLTGYPSDASKFLNGGGGWSAPQTDMVAVYLDTTPIDVTGTSMADLCSITIPGGLMGPNAAIKFWATGHYSNANQASRKIYMQIVLGATSLWDTGTGTDGIPAGGAGAGWYMQGIIQALASTSQQQLGGMFSMPDSSAAVAGFGNIKATGIHAAFEGVQPSSVNMAGSQIFKIRAQHNNTGCSITCDFVRVEVTA